MFRSENPKKINSNSIVQSLGEGYDHPSLWRGQGGLQGEGLWQSRDRLHRSLLVPTSTESEISNEG